MMWVYGSKILQLFLIIGKRPRGIWMMELAEWVLRGPILQQALSFDYCKRDLLRVSRGNSIVTERSEKPPWVSGKWDLTDGLKNRQHKGHQEEDILHSKCDHYQRGGPMPLLPRHLLRP